MMQTPRESTWLGHPPGLFVLFATEMWERFSYYGMRALLILYLTKHWLYADGEAAMIYGSYAAMVYARSRPPSFLRAGVAARAR